ncbi:MAG: hypothetical protein AB1634_08190 [Thermodesulfobacteriota bacterium]
MRGAWIADLRDLLDAHGHIAPAAGPARRLAEHFTAIVAMVSRPEPVIPEEFRVRCRRRPGRKRCAGILEVDLDPDTEEILWYCPLCADHGRIGNWQGTIWDLSHATGAPH